MYLDTSKTSDIGQHDVLITKLQKYGVEKGCLKDSVQLIEGNTFTHLCY